MRTILIFFLCLCLLSCDTSKNSDSANIRDNIDGLIHLADQSKLVQSDSCLTIARMAYELSTDYDYPLGKARSSMIIGRVLYEMGGFSPAISNLNEALKTFQEEGASDDEARVYTLLSKVYQRSENYSQAFPFLNKALAIYHKNQSDIGLAEVYGNFGHLYEKTQLYDSALSYQKEALRYFAAAGDTLGLADIHDNIGSIYEDLENYEEAHTHFQTALYLNRAGGNQTGSIVNLNNIGDVFRKKGEYKKAHEYTQQALKLAEQAQQDYQIKSALRDLSKVYFALGKTALAFQYLERTYEITDNIFGQQIAQEIAKTQAIYELEQKQQRIQILEKERLFNQRIVLLSSFGVMLFALLAGLIFYQQQSKNQKKRKLLETEAELSRAELENAHLNEEKLKAELENKRLKEDQLQQELELKSKSLTKNALHMIQKNEFLNDLRKKLKALRKDKNEDIEKKIKKLIRSIDLNFSMDDDWQEFETIFQQVHSEFFLRLKDMYPDLTPTEVRLCAMIRLNLHSKDMAAIMGISQDSLRISRYRLRKRLGLDKGASLYSYILSIG